MEVTHPSTRKKCVCVLKLYILIVFIRLWSKMQFCQLRTWHFQHHNRLHRCYMSGIIIVIFAVTLLNFTFWVSLSDTAPVYRLEWLDNGFTPCAASSPTFPHIPGEAPLCFSLLCCLCLFAQTGIIWRKRLDPRVLLHGNLFLQKLATNGRSLRAPAHQSHHEETEKNRELARNVQGIRY